ncbi:MAG: glycosyltransferase [Candidatus Gastranaerophilales bacterium]|nr:glycosyltransferase [Candidatus Gastranaerophilales bacterium]
MFSVLMSIYHKEKAEYLIQAIDSVINQTLKPSEIILVKDGPLTEELEEVITRYQNTYPGLFRIVALEINMGLGNALKTGVENCSYEIIARMDTDDIARPDRFEKQIKFLQENPDIDVVGSYISEFEEDPDQIVAIRKLPLHNEEITKFAKWRNPLNHMTVMFKKSSVLKAGNYNPPNRVLQDYELWVRLILNGSKFANIPDCLVNVRAGKTMLVRRKGFYYIKEESKLFFYFLMENFITPFEFLRNMFFKSLLRIIPDWSRQEIYNNFLRR